jgi:phosphoglycerate dehydrogenase-like enzyme
VGRPLRVALLDDYQRVARTSAPWEQLGDADVVSITEHIADDDALVRRLAGCDVVVAMRERTPFPRARLERLPDLRLLVTTGRVNAAIDVAAARELGILVCGTGGLASPTAELAWGLILALARHIPAEDAAMRSGGWQSTIGPELEGRTLGVVGLGRLGGRVATVGRAFGMDVIAWSENLRAEDAAALGVRAVGRDELLRTADVVTIHTRLSERTRGLIGAAELRAMRTGALLINTSRGPIVDEAALVAALHAGEIAGAALDVFDREPLPPDHPLRTAPNTVLTPHLGYVTTGAYRVYYGGAVEAIAAWRAGAPIRIVAA